MRSTSRTSKNTAEGGSRMAKEGKSAKKDDDESLIRSKPLSVDEAIA